MCLTTLLACRSEQRKYNSRAWMLPEGTLRHDLSNSLVSPSEQLLLSDIDRLLQVRNRIDERLKTKPELKNGVFVRMR